MKRHLIYPGGVLLAVGLGLTGCGGSGSPQSAASSTPASAQSQLLAYARCLRSHGIQVPDPDPANPNQLNIPKSAIADVSKLDAAEQSCRKYGGKLITGLNSTGSGNSREVQLAKCLRQHGIPVADPQPGQSLTLPPGTTTQSAAKAIEECTRMGSGSGG